MPVDTKTVVPIEKPATPAKSPDIKPETPQRIQTLVTLNARTDLYLELYARRKRMSRSDVIEGALQPVLKGIRVSFPDSSISEGGEAA